eukprot:943666_1
MRRLHSDMWMLDTLTLLVFNGFRAVAYAKVNIEPVPLPSFRTTLVTDDDTKKLVVGFSPFHFPDIPAEFKLYMVKGWPDSNAKKSVEACREWFQAEKLKIELEMIGEYQLWLTELKFDTDIDMNSEFAPGDEITFVFKDDDSSIFVFSTSKWGTGEE